MSEIQVNSVTFTDDGMVIQYITVPDDIRVKGMAVQTHTMQLLAGHPDYREDVETLHTRVVKILRNALEDFNSSEPYVPASDVDSDEDDDRGMGE